jgi:TolB-like protein
MRSKSEHDMEQKVLAGGISRDIESLMPQLAAMKVAIDRDNTQTYQIPTGGLIDLAVRWGQLCEMQRISYAFQEGA